MKLGHIVYKVDDLDEAVKVYRKKGFIVEYGKNKNPYNALIYFAEGPYFELLHKTGMPSFAKKVLRLFGKKAFVDRLDIWDNAKEGLLGVALENDRFDIDKEQEVLERSGLTFFKMKAGRTDTKNRKLKFLGIFPDDMEIPWLGCKFNINVRPPKGYTHPNGVRKIKSVAFGTKEQFLSVINELCDDEGLHLFIGDGVRDLEFEYDKAKASTRPITLEVK